MLSQLQTIEITLQNTNTVIAFKTAMVYFEFVFEMSWEGLYSPPCWPGSCMNPLICSVFITCRRLFQIDRVEVKAHPVKTTLPAAAFHIMWHIWWMQTPMPVRVSLSHRCPRVASPSKSSCQAAVTRNLQPSTTGNHPEICCHFASLFHALCLCAPSVCRSEWQLNDRFPLRTWHITLMPGRPAGWEKTWAARHSYQPHQSWEGRCDGLELPGKPFRWHPFFLSPSRETLSDWLRQKICQAAFEMIDRNTFSTSLSATGELWLLLKPLVLHRYDCRKGFPFF